MYDLFRRQTSTGSETGSEVLDVAAACRSWENFETFHRVFGGHPSWGVEYCKATVSTVGIEVIAANPAATQRVAEPAAASQQQQQKFRPCLWWQSRHQTMSQYHQPPQHLPCLWCHHPVLLLMLAGSMQVHSKSVPLQLASVTHRTMKNDPKTHKS